MKTLLISLLLTVSALTFGQNIDRDVVSTAGDHYQSNNASLSWTLGEVASEPLTNNTNTLSQGFHQGNLFVSAIEDELDLDFSIKAYPNPVLDILIVETQDLDNKYQIIDLHGEVIKNGIITSEKEEIDFTGLSSGIYFLSISGNETHKVIKK